MWWSDYGNDDDGGDDDLQAAPTRFSKGKLLICLNPQSFTLDTILIQDLTGRTTIGRLRWKYVYLKARNNSHIMH